MKVEGSYVQVEEGEVHRENEWGRVVATGSGGGVRISLLVWSFCFYFTPPTKQFLMNKPQNYPNVCWRAVKTFAYIYVRASVKGQVLSAVNLLGIYVCVCWN